MKEFASEVSRALEVERKDLIEKDFILHRLLFDLSKDEFFHKNFLFKGGTCLIKCYLGYFRFSEDVDFTWKEQSVFAGMSQKEIRRYLSGVKDDIGNTFEKIASRRALDFRCDKGDRNYVELGGGNKTATFKIWYSSDILNRRAFIKVQINFVEVLKFPAVKNTLRSLLKKNKEIEVLFPDYKEYSEKIAFDTYDVREIFCEKVRAILTRRGVKGRDFVDVYLISKEFKIGLEDMEEDIIDKTRFILDMYAKYRKNLEDKKRLLDTEEIFRWGEERDLLLSEIEEEKFYKFLRGFTSFMQDIAVKLEH
jgi:predicted nucleotidyltransferase component of viral defense system